MIRALAVVCLWSSVAAAQPVEPMPAIEKVHLWEGLRELEVTLSDVHSIDPRDYTVRVEGSPRETAVTAREVTPAPIALAFVVEAGDPALAEALAGLDLARFHPDSRAVVVRYGGGVQVIGAGHPSRLSADALRTTRPHATGDLALGIEHAIDQLAPSDLERRVLIVVGRGDDPDAAPGTLGRLRQRMRDAGIVSYAVVRDPGAAPKQFVREAILMTWVNADLSGFLRGAIDRLAARRVVTFAAVDAEDHRLAWDGVRREYVVNVRGADTWAESLVLPAFEAQCCDATTRPWHWAALAGALAILVAWLWARRAVSCSGRPAGS